MSLKTVVLLEKDREVRYQHASELRAESLFPHIQVALALPLRTMQEIFGVTPLLGDAANETDLSDLFLLFP